MLKEIEWKFYIKLLLRWLVVASLVGIIGGLIGSAFLFGVTSANRVWFNEKWLIFFLPFVGLLIVFAYHLADQKNSKGTNKVLDRIRNEGDFPLIVGPLIFVSTILTHLFGGSAGKEGAAVQLGGSIGEGCARLFKSDKKDTSLVILIGVASVFSAIFGTPIAAVFFALEVVSVGIMHYSGLVPCMIATITSYRITVILGVDPPKWNFVDIPGMNYFILLKIAIIGVMSAIMSILIVLAIAHSKRGMEKLMPNPYIRILIGGLVIVGLTMVFSSGRYNGSGSTTILEALEGKALPWDFAVKLLFTAITLGAGFKGGEIVPVLFIGSTMGATAGGLLGIDPGFAAAVGLIATFCGAVNSPVASIILAVELFGGSGVVFFAVACGVSYTFSGYYSLYSSQKIIYSKIKPEYININGKH